MSIDRLLSSTNISASGLSAERLRMEVAANNIANAHTTRTSEGGPYQRQQVVFAAAMGHARQGHGKQGAGAATASSGVRVVGVQADESEHPRMYDPGHPDADADGFVTLPNVSLPHEMVDMLTASRSYEANLKSLQTFQKLAENALSLLRGLR